MAYYVKNKYQNKILFVFSIFILLVIGYSFRWTFTYKFDAIYWENYYYTSQWNIPNSKRIISDEGVYRYIGFRLVNGENPFNVDYWVPPFGKYFYGLGAKYLGNPYWISWGWFLILLGIIYLMTKNLWAVLLTLTNPLLVGQMGVTMLDLPQAVFLLAHIGLLLKKKILLSGIMLGIVMGIKIGYFVPFVAILGAYYLLTNKYKIKVVIIFFISIGLGYVVSYFCYFMAHPNPIPWIRLHEKVINFWRTSGTSPHPLNLLGYIFLNKFEQVWENGRTLMTANEWTAFFPISVLLIVKMWFSKLKINNKYLLLLASVWLILCGMIDFWPRYLVPIVPVLVIIIVGFLKTKKILLTTLLIFNLWGLIYVLQPKTVAAQNLSEKFVTIVNPVRSRELWKDKSLSPIEIQYEAINKFNLSATWLIQNDVLNDKELINKIKKFNENQELGIFLEVSKNLALKSRIYFDEQRPWYDPGVVFLSSYDISDRKKIIDTMMKYFKNTFGYYPKSVGAWWIDSYSQQYLEKKYNIKIFLICADQKTTDKYGIWGQWWGYPYIPSPDNILVPGNSKSVVVQWAQRDLEKAYFGEGFEVSNYSLQANDYTSKKLDIKYFEKLANQYLGVEKLGQITVGLETGMESVGHETEFEKQLKWLSDNKINSLKMSDFAVQYRNTYDNKNPSKIVLGDWVLTPEERINLKLGEKTVYQNNMVFKDIFTKDDSGFLNRVYAKENLVKKKLIDIESVIKIILVIVGFLITLRFRKLNLWMVCIVGVLIWLIIHVRYSVVDGQIMIGLLIDNFRFVGINLKAGFINNDLSNNIAKSMLKLNFDQLNYIYWILLGIIIGKIGDGRTYGEARKNKSGDEKST